MQVKSNAKYSSAILSTFIRLPFVIKIFVLSKFLSGRFTQVLLYFLSETYAAGTQKRCLNEAVLSSPHNTC